MKTNPMKNLLAIVAACALTVSNVSMADESVKQAAPLKVLLVAGGCCHDYPAQAKLLKDGIENRIRAEVKVVLSESTSTETTFEIYESDDWATGYDVVIHDECSANVIEKPYVDRILAAHKNGVPAVNLHCAMHSYRWGDFRDPVELGADNAGWYEMIGIQSSAHGPKAPIDVTYATSPHPIIKGMENWTTIDEELYNNIRVFSSAEALASGDQFQAPAAKMLKKNPEAKPVEAKAVVAWTNEYGPSKTKIFSTTLGHYNDTVSDDRYMDLVVRGLLWATGNLSANGKATAAYAK
jgi:type 1 glutamine amidotransferase